MKRRFLYLTASALALIPSIAAAQDAAGQGAPDQRADEAGSDNTIIVTGEKVDRSLQDTTASIAVTTAERVAEENIQTLQEIFQRTANVTDTDTESVFSIRGMSSAGVSGAGASPLSTVYVDGAALPNETLYGAPTGMWDVEQVEILRGPQSTLQGLNALAGSIILRTRDPGWTWDARARAQVTDVVGTDFAVAGGGPLIEDELAFRVAAEKRNEDGLIHNTTRDEDYDPLDWFNVRAKLLWEPSGLPGLTARLGYSRTHRDGRFSFAYTDMAVDDYFNNRTNTSNDPNYATIDTDIANLELTYDLTDRLTLNSVGSWSNVDQFRANDTDQGPQSLEYGDQDSRYRTFSEELRLSYDGDMLTGLLGGYFFHRETESSGYSRTNVETPRDTAAMLLQAAGFDEATAGMVADLYVAALPVVPVDYEYEAPSTVRNVALFGDARLELVRGLELLAGFRYDRQRHTIANFQTATFAGIYPDPADYGAPGTPLYLAFAGLNQGVQGLVDQAAQNAPETTRTFEAFLPKAGVSYDWTDDLTTAFVVQRGYRAGGSSTNTARAQIFDYDPEYSWNYEFSFRSQWFDRKLTVNANAFYVEWTDQQVWANFGLNAYDNHTVNAGASHLKGFELEVSHQVSRAFDWYAALGHVRTRFDEFAVIDGAITDDFTGSEFPDAPHWTLSGGANLRWGDGFSANVNANHRSAVFTAIGGDNQADYRLDSRTLVNARVGYEADRWQVYAFASNLFNAYDARYISRNLNLAILGQPRVVGLAVEALF